jgi:hypothetical protein
MPSPDVAGSLDLAESEQKIKPNNGLRDRPKAGPAPVVEPHARMRKRVHDKIELGNRLAAGLPWAIAAGLSLAFGLTAISYRTDIVRAWPKSASVFAAIGHPANLYGVDIARVQARAGVDVKGPRVVVSGLLTSVSRKPEAVAYLKVSLVDSKGAEKLSWMVDPGIEVLQPGKTHAFESARSNPVRGDVKLLVVFAEPPPKTPRPAPPPPEPPTGKTGLMGAQGQVAPLAANQQSQMIEPATAR